MFAIPIKPGRLYEVRHGNRSLIVLAAHGCDAICIAYDLLGVCE